MANKSTNYAYKVPTTVEKGSYKVIPQQLFHKPQQLYPPIRFPTRDLDNSDTMEIVKMPIRQPNVQTNI